MQVHDIGVNELDSKAQRKHRHGSGVIITVYPSTALRDQLENTIKVQGKKGALLHGDDCSPEVICDGKDF
jgi:aminoglycoside phosphotransferase